MAGKEKEKDPCRVLLKDVRLSYPALWRPKGFGKNNDGEPAYQSSFIIDPEDKMGKKNVDRIEDAIEEAKIKKWGNKIPKLKDDKLCFKEGDEDKPEEDGMMVLSARNYKKPKVFDVDKYEVAEDDDGAPYAGCYVDAIVRIWAQDNEYGKRVNASLEAVRFRDDGDPFGAPPVDPDEFDDDDDDDRSSRRRRSRDEDGDDDRGSRRRGSRDDDGDDDDRSSSRRRRGRDDGDDDGDDDRGSRRRRGRDDDGDDDDDRSSRRRRGRDDDDGDDDTSSRRRRSRDDDDGDDDSRSRRRRGSRDDDEGDQDRPSRRRSRADDDEDDRPRRRRSRDDDVV